MKNYCFKKQNFNFFVLLILILFSGFCGSLLLNSYKETTNLPNAQSTTATFSIYVIGYNSEKSSKNYSPFSLSYSLLYDGKQTIVSGSMTKESSYTDTDSEGVSLNGCAFSGATGTYEKNLVVFVQKGRTLKFEISSTKSGCYVGWVYITYSRGSTYVSAIKNESISLSEYKTSYSCTATFDVGSSTESNTNIIVMVAPYCKYNLYNYNSQSYSFYTGYYSLTETDSSGYNYDNFKRTGYTLEGFYTGKNGAGTKIFDVNSSGNIDPNPVVNYFYTPNSNLYAYYKPITYSISYNLDGGTKGSSAPTSGTFDTALTISNPTKTGYTFAGWTASNLDTSTAYYGSTRWSSSSTKVTATSFKNLRSTSGTVTLTANWTANTYIVKYDGNENTGGSTANQTFTYNLSQNLRSNGFTRIGYTFAGWNTKEDGSGTSYSGGQSVKNLTSKNGETVTLYAQWQANQYSYKIVKNNGESDLTGTAYFDSVIKSISKPTKTGYTFTGWTASNINTSTAKYGITSNPTTSWNGTTKVGASSDFINFINLRADSNEIVTITANWTANNYSISYNLNGGTKGSSAPTSGTFDSVIMISNPEKTGYTFVGWTASNIDTNTAKYGTTNNPTTAWNGSTKVSATYFKNLRSTSGTVTLTANWTANTYTVQYNGNGNSGGSTASQTFTYDQTSTLQYNGFTKTGYVFIGWNTQANGSGTSYIAGQSVKNLTSINGGTVTLYAQWQATWVSGGIKEPEKDSENEYYLISNADELAWLAYQTETYGLAGQYKQIADIDLSDKIWLPIGRMKSFTGEYDGQGYKIIGLKTSDVKDANGQYLESFWKVMEVYLDN